MTDEPWPTPEESIASLDALRVIEALANEAPDGQEKVDEVSDLYRGRERDLAEAAINAAAVILKHADENTRAVVVENTRKILLSRAFDNDEES